MAQGAPKGRVAISVDGPSAERVRTELVSALPAGIDVIDDSKLEAAFSRQRIAKLGVAMGTAKHRKSLVGKLHKVARAIGADAVIVGAVPAGKDKGGLELQLIVVRSSRKGTVVDETVRFAKGASRAARWRSLLGTALDDMHPGAEPVAIEDTKDEDDGTQSDQDAAKESAADPSPEEAREEPKGHRKQRKSKNEPGDTEESAASKESEESEESDEHETVAHHASPTDALLIASAGLDFGGRQFHYNQRITNANLRPYDLPGSVLLPVSPGGALFAEIYPFARTGWTGARDVGVTAGGRYNLAKAQVGNATLDTQWYGWDVNLRGRVHLGRRGSSSSVGLEAGLGRLVFAFKGDPALTDILPGVDYHYLRIGADGRIPLGKVDVILGTAFRHLLTKRGATGATIPAAGSVAEHFPRAAIAGMDAKLGGAIRLMKGVEARLVLSYVRFWATFNARPDDTYNAEGATEQMVNADVGIAAFF